VISEQSGEPIVQAAPTRMDKAGTDLLGLLSGTDSTLTAVVRLEVC